MLRLSPLQVCQKVTIDDIFSEPDDLGLLVVEPLKIYSPTGNLPVSRLEEINAFYVVHAPLSSVLSVIKYILDGTISQYRMDNTTGKIVAKSDTGHSLS